MPMRPIDCTLDGPIFRARVILRGATL